jgi:hypothetical protein
MANKQATRRRVKRGANMVSNTFGLGNAYTYEVHDADGKLLCSLEAKSVSDAIRLAKGAGLLATNATKVPCEQR